MTLSTAKTHRAHCNFLVRVLSYSCDTLLTLQLHKDAEACKIGRKKRCKELLRSATHLFHT